MLEREISKTSSDEEPNSTLPVYFTRSWMSCPCFLEESRYRVSTYKAFADGLRRYLTRCLMNARPSLGQYEARSEVEGMIRDGGTRNIGGKGTRDIGTEDFGIEGTKNNIGDEGTRDAFGGRTEGNRGNNNIGNEGARETVDVLISKLEAWKKAIQLLEIIFLLRKVSVRNQ